jgi:preprotein translocase subunit Sss1
MGQFLHSNGKEDGAGSIVTNRHGTFWLRLRKYKCAALEAKRRCHQEEFMDGNLVGLVAVVMIFGIPMAAMYTFFRVRKLRSEERMAAIARGVEVPMQPELSEAARSRRFGILLVAGAIGYIVTFTLIGRMEPDAMIAATFGVIPLAVGLGFFVDHALIRRDARAQ